MKLKALIEKRADLQGEMEGLLTKAETEERAMSEEEVSSFDQLETEIRAIDDTIDRVEKARKFEPVKDESTSTLEERAFADYVMGTMTENRAGENLSFEKNGAIVPTTIANRIIKEVKDRCPILSGATIYNVKGELRIPVWGKAGANGDQDITVAYQEEFTEITADSGKFTSVNLSGYLAGALTLIGKKIENNGSFNVVDFIVSQMAEEIAEFIEGELLNGTINKATGILSTTNTKQAAGTTITADDLINLQSMIKQAFQKNACWTMHPDTFTDIKKIKDNNGRYLLQNDITGAFPFLLLGKPVNLSDNMPKVAAGKKPILYGDYSGLSVNFREKINIEVLREKYVTQHAIGVVAWLEFDSKISDNKKLATLSIKTV